MFKTKLHKHPRNKSVSFDKDSHTYKYKDSKGKETYLEGVTSLIGLYTAPFQKEKIAKGYARKHGMTVDEVLDLWRSDNEYGNNVHDAIEKLIKTGEIDEHYEVEVEYFLEAMEEYGLKPIAAEFVVYDEEMGRASMVDVVCEKDGELVLVDIKTMKNGLKMKGFGNKFMIHPLNHLSDSNYWKFCLQIGFYKDWLERLYEFPVSHKNYVFHVRPEGYKMVPAIPMGGEIKIVTEEQLEDN